VQKLRQLIKIICRKCPAAAKRFDCRLRAAKPLRLLPPAGYPKNSRHI
jgi:hypothetical protein